MQAAGAHRERTAVPLTWCRSAQLASRDRESWPGGFHVTALSHPAAAARARLRGWSSSPAFPGAPRRFLFQCSLKYRLLARRQHFGNGDGRCLVLRPRLVLPGELQAPYTTAGCLDAATSVSPLKHESVGSVWSAVMTPSITG